MLKFHFVKSRVIGPSSRPSANTATSFTVTFSRCDPPSHPSATATGFPVTLSRSDTLELSRAHVHQASFHCCCYCCPQLEALLDAPCAFLILPAVRRWRLSFRSPVPNYVLQVVVVQVAVALAEAVTPNRCYCCHLPGSCFGHPMLVAREAASLRPQGEVSCAEAPLARSSRSCPSVVVVKIASMRERHCSE